MRSNYSCLKNPGKEGVAHPTRPAEDAVLSLLPDARPIGSHSGRQGRDALTALGLDAESLSRILFHEAVRDPLAPALGRRPALIIPLRSAEARIGALFCLPLSTGTGAPSRPFGPGWTWGEATGLTAHLDDRDPEDPCLALCSDVLSGMAVRQAADLPVWAAVSLSCLLAAELPSHVFDLHLFLSRRPSGGLLVRRAAVRHSSSGRRVFVHVPDQTVRNPSDFSRSFLDVLREDGDRAIRRSLQRAQPFQAPGRRLWPQPIPIEGAPRPEEVRMRSVLRWIRRTDRRVFSRRQAQRALPTVFGTARTVQAALNGLAARKWIRFCEPPAPTGPGRPPGPRYEVNSRVFHAKDESLSEGGRHVT